MKITIGQIFIFACIVLLGWNIHLHKRNSELKTNIADRDITITSMAQGMQEYKAKDGTWNQRLINERQTAEQLLNSKDSTIAKIKLQVENANIKLQNALALAYTEQSIEIDTQIVYVRQKPDINNKQPDTTLDFSKLPHIVNTVKLTDTSASNRLVITNEQILITNAKREFVKPRNKFFIVRWLQKRHWVVYTDINNSNPYIKTRNAKFITIVKKNGGTKTVEDQ